MKTYLFLLDSAGCSAIELSYKINCVMLQAKLVAKSFVCER